MLLPQSCGDCSDLGGFGKEILLPLLSSDWLFRIHSGYFEVLLGFYQRFTSGEQMSWVTAPTGGIRNTKDFALSFENWEIASINFVKNMEKISP